MTGISESDLHSAGRLCARAYAVVHALAIHVQFATGLNVGGVEHRATEVEVIHQGVTVLMRLHGPLRSNWKSALPANAELALRELFDGLPDDYLAAQDRLERRFNESRASLAEKLSLLRQEITVLHEDASLWPVSIREAFSGV